MGFKTVSYAVGFLVLAIWAVVSVLRYGMDFSQGSK